MKDGVGRVRLGVILNLGVPVSRGLRAFGDYCDLGCAIVNRYIHGALRAGQKGAYLLVASGIDTRHDVCTLRLDASAVRTDFLGHAYYAKSDSIVDDIQKILTSETPPDLRNLIPATVQDLKYWIMPKSNGSSDTAH